ncbi:hypothetical protein BH23BAC1_BH23BAC1_30690 [soil metagenome]
MMDIVLQKAKKFYKHNLVDSITFDDALAQTINETNTFFGTTDKLSFLKFLIEKQSEEIKDHERFCIEDPEECDYSMTLRFYVFALENEVKRLSHAADKFNETELFEIRGKLDKIISDMIILKYGNEIIYDDFLKEFEELRDSVNLGKKTWRQLLLGKMFEMTASGIVSEKVSKGIIKEFQSMYDHFDFTKEIN